MLNGRNRNTRSTIPFGKTPLTQFTEQCEADQRENLDRRLDVRNAVANLFASHVINATTLHECMIGGGYPPFVASSIFDASIRASASVVLNIYRPQRDDDTLCDWEWLLSNGYTALVARSRKTDETAQVCFRASQLLLVINAGGL